MTASLLPYYKGEKLCAIWQNKDDVPNVPATAERLYNDIFRPALMQESEWLYNVWKASQKNPAILFDDFAVELAVFKFFVGVRALPDLTLLSNDLRGIAVECEEKPMLGEQLGLLFTKTRVKHANSIPLNHGEYLNKRMQAIAYDTGHAINGLKNKMQQERSHSEMLHAMIKYGDDGVKALIRYQWVTERKTEDVNFIRRNIEKYAVEENIRAREMSPPPSPAIPKDEMKTRISLVTGSNDPKLAAA